MASQQSEPCGTVVDAVVFDVGRVLYRWDLRCLFAKLIDDPQELEWFLANVVTEEWHFEHDRGRALADMVSERIARFPQYAPLIEAYAARFNETIPGPVSGSLELVADLSRAGVPLFAITNFGDEFWTGFRPTAPVFDLFADIVVSGVEKIAKPDPRIFRIAQRRFGHDPARMLFIDDNADNVAAAANEGWQVHYFRDAGQLRSALIAQGLPIA